MCTISLFVEQLIKYIKDHKIFGTYVYHIYTIEFQKRGLPHVHIALRVSEEITAKDADKFISAQLPEKPKPKSADHKAEPNELSYEEELELCELVNKFMTHKFFLHLLFSFSHFIFLYLYS